VRSVMFMQVNLRIERLMSIGALRLTDGPMRGEKRIGVSAYGRVGVSCKRSRPSEAKVLHWHWH
jgi:hypothetical protein